MKKPVKNLKRLKTKEYNYTIILEREEDGGYHAFCPALPGCHTQGDTYDETMENIKDAVKLYIESLKSHGEPIPEEDITIKPLKVAI
ncbi:MAG TPA: type II toxin-antitoxin system HicB family antitoxin [bacterium]